MTTRARSGWPSLIASALSRSIVCAAVRFWPMGVNRSKLRRSTARRLDGSPDRGVQGVKVRGGEFIDVDSVFGEKRGDLTHEFIGKPWPVNPPQETGLA